MDHNRVVKDQMGICINKREINMKSYL